MAVLVKALPERGPRQAWGLGRASSTPFPRRSPEVARRSLAWPEVQAQGAWSWLLPLALCFVAKVPRVETVGCYPMTIRLLLACQSPCKCG